MCWGNRHLVDASGPCKLAIERQARFAIKWTDDWLEPKFLPARWRAINDGHITYRGDKLQMQNVFGAWEHVIYECDFDTTSRAVLDVRARPGRL